MAAAYDTPVVSPVLVGREAQLAALDQALRRARAGQGGMLLLGGEAGIGKSRLVAEARERAGQLSLRVLQGTCFEPTRTLPYAPLLDLLRVHFAALPPDSVAREMGAAGPELVKLLPELSLAVPGLAPSTALDPQQERYRLFETLIRFFLGLPDAAVRPGAELGPVATGPALLVIIEDLHWADDTSLEFLPQLARRGMERPILLLATYRSDEVQPALQHTLATLDRTRLATDLAVDRLSRDEVDALLRAIFRQSHPIRPDFLATVQALTDGNPFFVEEILRALIAAGEIFQVGGRWERKALGELHIPRSVQDAVTRRAERLSPDARQVLQLAAVAGQRFDFAVLRELTGDDERRLLDLVRELIAAQLVVEESAERFAFRHALTREAVYAELLSREQQALHRAIGDVLERLHAAMPEPYLADLAYHFHAAGDWGRALDYGSRAGERARALYAPGAAIEHFTRAIDAARALGAEPSVRLHRERGLAFETLGEFESARQDLEVALALARRVHDQLAEWQALLDLGMLWAGHDYARAGEYFQAALDLARVLDDPAMLAHALIWVANWHTNSERPSAARAHLVDALAIFEHLGDERGIAETLDQLSTAADIGSNIAACWDYCVRAAKLFESLGNRQGLSSLLSLMHSLDDGYVFHLSVVPADLPIDVAAHAGERSLSLAREIGLRAGESYALINLALRYGPHGDFGRALATAEEGLAIAREIEHHEWTIAGYLARGLVYLDLLAPARAAVQFAIALEPARDSSALHFVGLTAGSLVTAHVALGDLAAAEALLSTINVDLPMETIGQRHMWAARAQLALAAGRPGEAMDVVERLFASATDFTGQQDLPHLAKLRGDVLVALGRADEADAAYRAALERALKRGLRPLALRCHIALGHLFHAQRRAAEADREFQAARTLIEELASGVTDDELREGFRNAALAQLPAAPSTAPNRLTAREQDVAALVARGLSNREVAEALFVGERTVETHVGNILGKLGFTSRAQIAAWAVETGLAKSDSSAR